MKKVVVLIYMILLGSGVSQILVAQDNDQWSGWQPVGTTSVDYRYKWDKSSPSSPYVGFSYQFRNNTGTRQTVDFSFVFVESGKKITYGRSVVEPGFDKDWTPRATIKDTGEREFELIFKVK